ncbi:MAG: hypothetical protein B7Y43_13065 [Sphingomonas sp. 28-62-20]|uniref:DUF3833 family protein n=1 Tax=Sphingomonas sp. 28-62-20 TaxID=1970433 RepID=UPI000BD19024|nr:MAG: hypothetical protein B7Y43_13065 [Sphingomonas sp. 28-62-20]
MKTAASAMTGRGQRRSMGLLLVLGMMLLSGCVAMPRLERVAPAPHFAATDFFAGQTEGRATVKVILRTRHPVAVHGTGHLEPDGSLVLDQMVEEAGQPAKKRQWRIRETAPDHYTGTLSDAISGVTGVTRGNRLVLRFTMKGGYRAKQFLTLRPDGQSAHNVMVVRKFGITVAVLDEIITRVGP